MPRILDSYYWHMGPGVVVGDYDCCYSFMRVSNDTTVTLSGVLPLTYTAKGWPLIDYTVYGNAVQAATPSSDNPVEVQAVGERTANLFDKATVTEGMRVTTTGLATSLEDFASDFISVSAGKIYTIYGLAGLNTTIYFYDSANGFLSYFSTSANVSATFTVPDGASKLRFTGLLSLLDKTMLNEGGTALPYEPYGYKIPFTTAAEDGSESITTTVYLDNPLYKIGDYADCLAYAEQKVERVIGEMVLTGEENITLHARFNTHISVRIPTTSSVLRSSHVFCTHLRYVDFLYLYSNGQYGVSAHHNVDVSNVYFSIHGLTDINSYTSWLKEQYAAGTPVKVWYVLQTPESESVELPKLPTLAGPNFLNTDTTVRPSNVTITGKGLAEITTDPVMTDLLAIMEDMDE